MSRIVWTLLAIALVALALAPTVHAFGAGNIPSYSYLEDKAYRHGDIEDIIAKLFKAAGGGFLSRGTKFSGLDVKRVYFGNWLRDYSQAVDVGALKKANLQTIINVCMVLGFLAHGYVTGEFEVTKERLGCYLPTEHIDNPKGYADGEDARQYDPRLRGPVDPQELQIDPMTGMKNYIANENQGWDTSKSLVRRTLQQCIHQGRLFRSNGRKEDQYEAFRLLGQALHTLEDFSAHSNFCELALISYGNDQVFPHVGRNVKVRSPRGKDVYPLVTGTFGGADFIHSLMGEATDHLSEASVSDLSQKMANARSISDGQANSGETLRQLFFNLPGSDASELSREMDNVQNMRAGQPGGVDPSTMSPQELHSILWQVLAFRDSVMKKIENTIDRIPGLSALTEKISNSLSVFVITTIEPFVKPLLGTATQALGESSQAVIDSHDQYEVWNDWNASDPTHSFLSKDHFALLLNCPAGEIAQLIVEYTVPLVVKAWDDTSMHTDQVTEPVLECLFHPDFHDGRSQIQRMMLEKMKHWFDSHGHQRGEILQRLTAESVKSGRNKRIGDNSTSTGHVHNTMLPDGGLQSVLAQHNVHVPGAGVLNAGQDLLGGKMPWQQGFGSGGAHAWREIDPNAPDTGAPPQQYVQTPYEQQQTYSPSPSAPAHSPHHHSHHSHSHSHSNSHSHPHHSHQHQHHHQHHSPQTGYNQQYPGNAPYAPEGGYQSPPPQQYPGYEQSGYGAPPQQYDPYGPPPGQYAPPPGQYGAPYPQEGQWGQQPPPQQGYPGYGAPPGWQ